MCRSHSMTRGMLPASPSPLALSPSRVGEASRTTSNAPELDNCSISHEARDLNSCPCGIRFDNVLGANMLEELKVFPKTDVKACHFDERVKSEAGLSEDLPDLFESAHNLVSRVRG